MILINKKTINKNFSFRLMIFSTRKSLSEIYVGKLLIIIEFDLKIDNKNTLFSRPSKKKTTAQNAVELIKKRARLSKNNMVLMSDARIFPW